MTENDKLRRLRAMVVEEHERPPRPSPNSPADVLYRHFLRMIDRLLAETEAVPQEPQEQPGDEVLRGFLESIAAHEVGPVIGALVELCRRALVKGGAS